MANTLMTVTRCCKTCGACLPLEDFAARGNRRGPSWHCRPCSRASKRTQERRRADPDGRDAISFAVDHAPDRAPAIRLREELECHREGGRPWRSAWPHAQSVALRDLPVSEAEEWRQAFSAMQRAWEASYEGTATGLVMDLPGAV